MSERNEREKNDQFGTFPVPPLPHIGIRFYRWAKANVWWIALIVNLLAASIISAPHW